MDKDYVYLDSMINYNTFSRSNLADSMKRYGMYLSEASFKVTLQKLLKNKIIIRVGRNQYDDYIL